MSQGQYTAPCYHARINDPKLRAVLAFANSPSYNSHSLESHWYPVYQYAFKKFEDHEHCLILCPQFAVSHVFHAAKDDVYISRPSTRRPGDPREYLLKKNSLGENTFILADTDAAYKAQLTQESEQSAEEDEEVDEIGRRWRLPDFVVLATPYPTKSEDLVGKASVPLVRILVPSLPERTAIIPVVIEVKKQYSNNLSHILASLEAVELQLEEQLRFMFSDFPWQTEAIAIAGVGMYWLWWKAYRSNYDIEEGSSYVLESSDSDIGRTRTQHTGRAAIPFILGTKTSDNEISKLQKMIGQMVDDRKWESSDDQYTEHQGKDLEEHWQSLGQRHYGHQGGSAVGAEDGEDVVGGGDDGDEGGRRIEDDSEAVEERSAKRRRTRR